MTPLLAEVFGWAGTVTGTVLGLPQLIQLARTRNAEGLSLRAWQAMLAVNLGWTAHGIRIGQPPQAITSALSLVATVPILLLLARHGRRSVVLTFLPGITLAFVMVLIDHLSGSGAYGAFAVLPAVIGYAGQSVALIRAVHVAGVSAPFLVLAVLNQVVWFTWANLVGDLGSIIATATTGAIVLFNVAWYVARRCGLGPHPRLSSSANDICSSPEA